MTPRHLLQRAARTAAATLLTIGALGASAAGLAVGDPAPDFSLEGSDGQIHRLADYRGTTVVLAWFPKAFTGG